MLRPPSLSDKIRFSQYKCSDSYNSLKVRGIRITYALALLIAWCC
jgi:hypothetical protein